MRRLAFPVGLSKEELHVCDLAVLTNVTEFSAIYKSHAE